MPHATRRLIPGILLICAICATCYTGYNPAFFPSYDVLKPGEAVEINPVGVASMEEGGWLVRLDPILELAPEVGDAFFLVNADFLKHYRELKDEIKRMRAGEK